MRGLNLTTGKDNDRIAEVLRGLANAQSSIGAEGSAEITNAMGAMLNNMRTSPVDDFNITLSLFVAVAHSIGMPLDKAQHYLAVGYEDIGRRIEAGETE